VDSAAALEVVRRAWRDVLALEDVQPDDDFFLLGGHSLLVLEVVDAIEAETGTAIPLGAFFEDPTPRSLASHLTEGHPVGEEVEQP
jgi:nonribosomal peptide synthetase DhbF